MVIVLDLKIIVNYYLKYMIYNMHHLQQFQDVVWYLLIKKI